MTKILPLVLDRQCSDLKLTNLSLKFEQGTRGRNFWFWYALFGDPKLSFAGIGRKAHVSRQRVYQIYKAWFAEIFPKRHMIIHRPKSYPLLGKARTLRDHLLKGQKAGLLSSTFKVQPVPRKKKGWSQSLLKLTRRGHPDLLCSCFVVSGIHQYGSPTIYARLETREKGISGTDFLLILHVGYEREDLLYVIPTGRALERVRTSKGAISLYLPLRRHKFSTSKHYKYREGWEYLNKGALE